jgi:hypothetical protein
LNSRNNRQNHNFQILHFMVGGCHTADGAYALLCDLREDRKLALETARAGELKARAKRLREELRVDSNDKIGALEARAEMMEMEARDEVVRKCMLAAESELAFIERCMERLEPHRKYKDLPLPEAHEAAQREEWLGELLRRAENFLLLTGTIPPDEFNTMRSHPDFSAVIAPRILELRADGAEKMLTQSRTPKHLELILKEDS